MVSNQPGQESVKARSKNEIVALISSENNRDTVIKLIAEKMHARGMVEANYGESVIERENAYPTGVPTEPVAVAIPHSERSQVSKTGIGVAVLQNGARFASMDNPERLLDVRVVFMLAVTSNDGHLAMIQDIMELIQDGHVVDNLLQSGSADEIELIMHKELSARENQR